MADKRDIVINLLGTETVSPAANKAGDAVGKLGNRMDATADDAKRLDREIDHAERSLRELAVQYARTGDAAERIDLNKAMRKQQTELRKLTKTKDLLPDFGKAGEQAAEGFGASFVTRVGPLLAKAPLGATGATLGAIIGVPLVATLGAAVSAGILGGVAGGGIIGGVSLAAKDARVQAAGKHLADAAMGDLEDSATRFVGPTVRGIQIIEGAWHDVADEVDGVFAATSRYVEPLARGVAGAVEAIGPGLREAAEAAGPVVRELSDGLPRIGTALSGLLSTAADHADEAASAVRLIVMGIEAGINVTSSLVGGLGTLYGALVNAGSAAADFAYSYAGWIPIVGDKLADNRDRMHELRDALKEGGGAGTEAGTKIAGGLLKIPPAADTATEKVRTLGEAIDEATGHAIDSEQANIRLEEAIDNAAEAAKKNGDGIDANIPKQRANREALVGIASAAKEAAAKILAEGGSQEDATAASERGRRKFLETAAAMKVKKDKAIELANKLFGIPNVDRSVSVKTAKAQAAIAAVQAGLGKIHSKNITVGVYYKSNGDLKLPGGTSLKGAASGGPVTGPGPKGVDSVPMLLAPGEHVLTAREVDAAGGQDGVERIRAALRGGRPLARAGAGGSVGGGGAASVLTAHITVNVPPAANLAGVGRHIAEALDAWAAGNGIVWRRRA